MSRLLKKSSWILLGASLLALTTLQFSAQDRGTLTAAEARKIIADSYREWGRARVALDKKTFEKMLAPGFSIQQPGRRLAREEFIDGISVDRPGQKLTRCDAAVLTVQPTSDGWVAIIQEKLEFEAPDGNKGYSLRISRVGWKQEETGWMMTFSEVVGHENWTGGAKPPFTDWE